MALLSLLFRNLAGARNLPSQIGLLTVDVTLEESHELGAELTDWPIEGGALITDHVRLQPRSLTVRGFVSDTPLNAVGLSLGRSRAASAFFILETMWQARIPFVVVSQLRVYRNMIIDSLVVPKQREEALRFTCTMREVTIVSGQNTLLPATSDTTASNASPQVVSNGGGVSKLATPNVSRPTVDAVGVDAGRQVAAPVTEAITERASVLYGIFN